MNKNKKGHNIIEHVVFFLGVVVLIGLISYLTYQLVQKKDGPPHLVITTSYQPKMEHYSYKVQVENMGEETAESANIMLSLYQNGKPVETGTITIAYVPIKSTETAWIVFHAKRKPNDSLVVSSITYVKP